MAEPLAHALLSRLEAPLAARLRTARELHELGTATGRAPEPVAWAAALPELAALLPGGLPRGALTELAGRRSSGRMGLVLALLAATTTAGENAALVDLGDGLDPQRAAAAGIALERLLWARPHELGQALATAEALLVGGFPLVVADLGLPPIPGGRGRDAQWLRLARAARERGARLLVSTPVRCCGIAAAAALTLERRRTRWLGAPRGPRLFGGIEAKLVLEKVRGGIGRERGTTLEEPLRRQNDGIEAGPVREKAPSTEAPSRAQVLFPPGGREPGHSAGSAGRRGKTKVPGAHTFGPPPGTGTLDLDDDAIENAEALVASARAPSRRASPLP